MARAEPVGSRPAAHARSRKKRSRYGKIEAEPARPTRWWQRLRSAVFLAMLAVSLGLLLAAVVGATVLAFVLALRHAVG
jgi:hypothetical protein